MAFDLEMFADKLNRYRAQFQVSLQDMEAQTGISIERLNDITTSKKEPTGDEVLIIADFFKCDFKFFISNEKLAPFEQTEELFRRHGSVLSPQDKWAIQEFLFLCECQQFLLQEIPGHLQIEKFKFKKTGTYYKRQGQQAAAELRRFLDFKEIAVPLNIFREFRRLGVHVFRRQLGQSAISGIYIKHPVAGDCVLVNYSEDLYRQRFTAAHEVAHAILDDEKDFVVSFTKRDKKDFSEMRANAFAADFLMPPELLEKIPDPTNWNSNKILSYARKLMVNPEALAYALKSSKLISDRQVAEFKVLKIPQTEKIDPELPMELSDKQRINKEAMLKKGLSGDFLSLCLQAYEIGIVTRGRLAEILLTVDSKLDELCSLYGGKLNHGD